MQNTTRVFCPKLFYAVVLRPNSEYLTRPQRFPEYQHCSDFATVCKEQHHYFSKSWTCGIRPIDRFIAPPLIGEEFDRLFMFREFRFFFHQSSSHSCFFRAQESFQIPFLARCQSSGGYHTTNQR